MQAQTIDARIVLTALAFVFALVVVAAAPLTALAADGPDEFAECRTGSYVTYLECIEANVGISGQRGTASVDRPAFVLGTDTDFLFMELNMWGEDFAFTPRAMPYFPSPERNSIIDSSITTY